MTLLGSPPGQQRLAADLLPTPPRSADATTILAILVTLQFVLPSALIFNGIPLSLSAATLVALLLGALWLGTQLTTTLGAAKGRNPVRTALFLYAIVLVASYGSASAGYLPPDERKIGDHMMVTVFALVFVGLAACDGVRSRARLYFLLRVMVVCGSAVAVVGILQFLFNYDLTPHLRPPGMHMSTSEPTVQIREGLRRVDGTAANPIEFGVFCAMMLPLALHTAFAAKRHRRPSGLWWTCAGLIATGLMFSVSRSAIVAVTCAGLVLLLGWPAQRRVWMAVAGLGFLVVIKFVSPGLLGAFFSLFRNAGSDDSVQWRTHDYATARDLISLHPWLGRGIGTWYAPKHEVFDNQYLLTLVDVGVVGLVAFLGIFVAAIYAAVRVMYLCSRVREPGDLASTDRDLALSVAASLAVVFPTFATFDFTAFPKVTTLTFVLVGFAGALLRVVNAEVAGDPPDPHAIV
jgi:O-antigen ligase